MKFNEISSRPILTIGIPTYNREVFLRKQLENIYSQIGKDLRFEILVCDNNSLDNTEKVVDEYRSIYTNLLYYKNDTNIGPSRNIQKVLELANGEYINLHGDDDYFNNGVYKEIINMIVDNTECDVMFLLDSYSDNYFKIKCGVGLNNYLKDAKYIGTITKIIIKNYPYKQMENKEKFLDSFYNHVYIQLQMLTQNPKYCMLFGPISRWSDTASAGFSGYNIMEATMKNYLDILYSYEGNGLTNLDIKYHKKTLVEVFMWLIDVAVKKNMDLSLDRAEELFIKYYKGEEYFQSTLINLRRLLDIKEKD